MDSINDIKNSIKEMPKITKVVILSFSILFLLVIVMAFVFSNKGVVEETALVEVTDYSPDANIPNGYRFVVEKDIGNILKKNSSTSGLTFSKAVVRDGSYSEEDLGDAIMGKFIVDIPELEYSFALTVVWAKGVKDEKPTDPDVTIECPHYLDVIYKNKKCIAESPNGQIKKYLPHYQKLDSGQKISVSMQRYNDETYLAIEVKSCGDNTIREAAINATRAWIKSIYMDPNDYTINAFDICGKKK